MVTGNVVTNYGEFMLIKTKTTAALRFLTRLVPAFYWSVIEEAIAAIEWRKANDPTYVEREHES